MSAWIGANPILAVLIAVVVLILIIAGLALLLLRGEEGPAAERAELDAYLDETAHLELTHDETMRDLREADGPAGAEDDEPADGEPLPLDLPGPLAPPAPLTPKQRRRAVHKGRIPRDLPGGGAPAPAAGEHQERLLSPVLAAELETGRLVAAMRDESRQAEATAVWAEIGGLVDDAYRWWSAPGRWELAA
jgi:hypothetical protein